MSGLAGPMSTLAILGAALTLYRRQFKTLAVIAASVYVPFALLIAAVIEKMRSFTIPELPGDTTFWSLLGDFGVPRGGPEKFTAFYRASRLGFDPELDLNDLSLLPDPVILLAAGLGALLFLGVVYPLSAAALIWSASAGYLGENAGLRESFKRGFSRLGRLLPAQGLATLVIAFGVLCCVVPGVLFALWLMLVPAVAVLEEVGAMGSLARSRALMRGELLRGAMLLLTAGAMGLLAGTGGACLVLLVPWPNPFISDFLIGLIQGLTFPWSACVLIHFYYDLRVRKEGLGWVRSSSMSPTIRE